MTRTAIVVGATSYVGGFVVQELLAAGHEVIAVTRQPELAQVLLGEQAARTRIVASDTAVREVRTEAQVVVNLAYVKTVDPHRARAENRRLVELVDGLATATGCPHVIHASTIAVFGVPLRERPGPVAVPRRRDDLYVDLKSQAEAWFEDLARRSAYQLSIVRLGNVIGPGSLAWVAALAQRLLEGKPLGWTHRYGPSNATYATNIGHYFRHLAERPAAGLAPFGVYHHLSEFAAHSWDELLTTLERTLGIARVSAVPNGDARASGAGGARGAARLVGALRRVYAGPAGSYARAALDRLPRWLGVDRLLARAKATRDLGAALRRPRLAAGDAALCDFLAGDIVAPAHVVADWTPAVPFAVALEEIGRWLDAAGFVVARDA
jgi:nucleoside-diphosphate-sugar epimerase